MSNNIRKTNDVACKKRPSRTRLTAACLMIWCMVFYGLAPLLYLAQTGNIAPSSIEIDVNANLNQGDSGANLKNPGAGADWIADSLQNNDTDSDPNDAIAIGINTDATKGIVTGAAGGLGHWKGVRVIDQVGGNEIDQFVQGGKENDTSTWNVQSGSIGSAKYDVSQAYIANNQTNIFFGMERRGNNGTTAFDFEFNQNAPASSYIPTRTIGDVLFTFEMISSGGGSAVTHVFIWDGTAYVEQDPATLPAGVVSSINTTTVAPEPWGYVNDKGDWVLSPNIPKFEFAEAQVPLSVLPNVNGCGGFAYTQVRTRSSSTANSDLKDTTKIFRYVFGGPTAAGQLTAQCDLKIDYDGSASKDSNNKTVAQGATLSFSWQFQKFTGTDPTNDADWTDAGAPVSGVTGTFNAPSAGTYRAKLTISDSGGGGGCNNSVTTNSATVFSAIAPTAVLGTDCDGNFTYTGGASGGSGSFNFSWKFYKLVSGQYEEQTGLASTLQSGSLSGFSEGHYKAVLTVSNKSGLACPIPVNSNELDVRNKLTASASKTASGTSASAADSGFTATATGSTNAGSDAVTFQWQRKSGASYVDIATETGTTLSRSMTNIFTDGVIDSEATASILGDSYKLRRGTLTVRVRATRTLNGCTADSGDVLLKAIKAIDP